LENTLRMKLALIPPGEFQMGSPVDEIPRGDRDVSPYNEWPHRVRITQPFLLGVYEVTQREWEELMGSQPSWFSSNGDGKDKVSGLDTSRFPVEQVSWEEATEFCRKLSQREGKPYRLPTEAEWEYACRAGTTTTFHFGNLLNGDKANVNGNYPYGTNTKGRFLERPGPVGSYSGNAFGLYDMHGNVSEWCNDWYDGDYYGSSNASGADPMGPSEGSRRVQRGGSWSWGAEGCRTASRGSDAPTHRGHYVGFRLALSFVGVPGESSPDKKK
jgi:formylglycine-generating enzyme required for sulfatase activity